MRNLLVITMLSIFLLASCTKENVLINSVSLLSATHYNADPNYTFEYDDQNRLIKCITNGGKEVKEYYYDEGGLFTGFKEVTQNNAIYPIRRFTVEVNTSTEISGEFNLYDPSDQIDLTQSSHIKYEIENGLIKEFNQSYANNTTWKKSFEHNSNGDLTAIQLFENPDDGHLYRMEFYSWDEKDNTNLFVSHLQTYPSFDIIPGIKLSNHNMLDEKQFYQNVSCCELSKQFYEYNDFNQVTRIYTISQDVYNEVGEIEIPGGEEIDIATFDYIIIE